jgi:hypothetical protein
VTTGAVGDVAGRLTAAPIGRAVEVDEGTAGAAIDPTPSVSVGVGAALGGWTWCGAGGCALACRVTGAAATKPCEVGAGVGDLRWTRTRGIDVGATLAERGTEEGGGAGEVGTADGEFARGFAPEVLTMILGGLVCDGGFAAARGA